MKIGRNMIIAIMITFCFTATLFMVIPIKSANSPYDPWIDYNDDGKISLQDLVSLANSYGTAGDPTKNVNALNSYYEWGTWNITLGPSGSVSPLPFFQVFNDTRGYRTVSFVSNYFGAAQPVEFDVWWYPSTDCAGGGPAFKADSLIMNASSGPAHGTYQVVGGSFELTIDNLGSATVNLGLYIYVTA